MNDREYWTDYGRRIALALNEGSALPIADKKFKDRVFIDDEKIEKKIKMKMKSEKTKPDKLVFLNGFDADVRIETANRIIKALRLCKNEAALLNYFATCSSGFRPSNKVIMTATGINEGNVNKVKDALEKKGVITCYYAYPKVCNKNLLYNIEPDFIIQIDWKDIFRNAEILKDNNPKLVREDNIVKRVPVVKEIPHINLTEIDKLIILINSTREELPF